MEVKFRIAVDFDGTLCKNRWPEIGEANTELIEWLIKKSKEDHIILWTLREDHDERTLLSDAVDWCKYQGLEFASVNEQIHYDGFGYQPRKFPCEMMIDDRSFNPCMQTMNFYSTFSQHHFSVTQVAYLDKVYEALKEDWNEFLKKGIIK